MSKDEIADNFYLIKTGSVRIYVPHPQDNTEITLARLEKGDYFGEQALLNEKPGKRNASAKALKDTILYAIPHETYQNILDKKMKSILKKIGNKQLFEMLTKQLETFGSIKRSVLKDYAGKIIKFANGKVIFNIDEPADKAYFILAGHVIIELSDGHFTELGPNQLFGEVGVLTGAGRAGTARAKGKLVLLSFDADAFRKMHETSPEIQQLVSAMSNVYQVKHRGVVNIYHGNLLNMPAISAIYQLENDRSVISAKVIGKPIFTMSFNDVKDTTTLHHRQGRTTKRELVLKENKIVGIMSLGDWDELGDVCDMLLNEKIISAEQIQIFTQEGILNRSTKKTLLSADERAQPICLCMNISKGQIFDVISAGAKKTEDVSTQTGAGTVCGSCRLKLSEMLGLRAWTPVNIIKVTPLHEDIYSFRLQPMTPVSGYKPGQHIVIQGLIDDQFINRNYTLTSVSGKDDFIEITVKREPKGYFSRWLFDNADKNPLIRISDPQGDFVLNEESDAPVVCFAGGIGVTPALAFARFISAKNHNRRLHIDYSAQTQADFILLAEWEKIIAENKNITLHLRATREQGILEFQNIEALCKDFSDAEFYICGPKAFEQSIVASLADLKILPDKVKTEQFTHAGSPVSDMIEM